ncbi:MAG: CPBP family intramembrane metalloprotease [Methanobrevibacter sp.]|jgi:membrane protease YdiL (CAAX protease family)|nr:CPBP family intramembrane metalloprotease [Candidatus Methanoflexus mossambicus]
MTNKYLDNGKLGKSSLKTYLISIIFIGIVGSILGAVIEIIAEVIGILPPNTASMTNPSLTVMFITTIFSFGSFFITIYLAIKYIHKRDFMTIINTTAKNEKVNGFIAGLKRFRWIKFLKGFGIFGIFLTVTYTILFMFIPFDFKGLNLSFFVSMFIFGLIALFVQCGLEELLFRGYLNQAFASKINQPLIVIAISSLLFGVTHLQSMALNPYNILTVVMIFIVGIILSIATLVTGGLEFSWGVHLINNFFNFVLITNSSAGLIKMIPIDPVLFQGFGLIQVVIIGIIFFVWKKEEVLNVLSPKKIT